MTRRILFWVHDPEAPSFRHRLAAHIPALEEAGFACEIDVFPRRRYVRRVLERRQKLAGVDLLVIAKLKLEIFERGLVRRAAHRIVYDVDDAVFLTKPRKPGEIPGRSRRRIDKFRGTCAISDAVTAGNAFVGRFAREAARRVEIVPAAIDLNRYPPRREASGEGRQIVWIGLPENLPYLAIAGPALRRLAREFASLELVVVSSRLPADPGLPARLVAWSPEIEGRALAAADVGIMPLSDDDWSRGKGGFKLMQYMAAGLPVVASPVGINRDLVVPGRNGFLASSEEDWFLALRQLLLDAPLRQMMGRIGRETVERTYALPVVSGQIVSLYRDLLELQTTS